MKIFAIRDESADVQKDLAYLLYYELEKRFYIELPEGADPWELPLLLDSFVKQNETTVNSYWSKIWVQQRIIPTDRQNIGEILRDNQLEEYDEYELLTLAMGRCAQDDYYLVPIDEKDLPEEIRKRFAVACVAHTKVSCDLLGIENGFLTRRIDRGQPLGKQRYFTTICQSVVICLELRLQIGELSFCIKSEVSVIYPCEIRRLAEIDFSRSLALVLSEAYYRLVIISENESSCIIYMPLHCREIRQESHIVLKVRIFVELSLENFICGERICLCRMCVLEFLTAIEAVCSLEIAWLHLMEDGLYIHHLFLMKVDVCLDLHVTSHSFDFLCEHRKVELR